MDEDMIRGRIDYLLNGAIKKFCGKNDRIGVLFSGGVDSTIAAIVASKYAKVVAYTAGTETCRDIFYGKKFAKKKNKNITAVHAGLDIDEIRSSLKDIIHITGERNPVQIGVAIPFYFAAKKASEDNLKTMLCGQGADELFGGYNKYIEHIKVNGYDGLQELMNRDIDCIYETNLKTDIAVVRRWGVELYSPFCDEALVEYVKSVPIEYKIHMVEKDASPEFECTDEINGKKYIRKYILRKLGLSYGVPDSILNRRKKAAQYGSESHKSLERIAKKSGYLKVGTFLEELK